MSIQFHEAAREELDEATSRYEEQQEGLGEEFAQEVQHALHRIENHPQAWSLLGPNVRRCRTNRFPYGLVYTIRGDDIVIVAVMHLRRQPGYWQDRLSD